MCIDFELRSRAMSASSERFAAFWPAARTFSLGVEMRRLSLLLTLSLVACTALAMVYSATFPYMAVVSVGGNVLSCST